MNYEYNANKYNISCLYVNALIITIVFILNKLNIFIIADHLIMKSCISCLILYFLVILSLKFLNLEKSWIKYYILTFEIIIITIMSTFLTYHLIVFMGVPFLMAAHYHDKKISWYTYIINSIGIIISVLIGYEYGIADMNMVALTTDTINKYIHTDFLEMQTLSLAQANKILLFFAFPRILITFVFLRMSLTLADSAIQIEKKSQSAVYESTHDKMTGLYNKNQFIKVKQELAKENSEIGILYFDINNLKDVNDTYNHEKGDTLICMAAKSLEYISSENTDIFRIGGDEFVMIISDCVETDLKTKLKVWEHALRIINEEHIDLNCNIAVGYAIGNSNKIESLIKNADKMMYEDKKTKKAIYNHQIID